MMEKMIALQQKRRSKKGGFTLVELIVVLVILAILAALLIPALTGYIDKAREKQVVAETRQLVMAAQTIYDEHYGAGMSTTVTNWDTKWNDDLKNLSEVTTGTISNIAFEKNKVKTLTYTNSKNVTCAYDSTKSEMYSVSKANASQQK